MRETFVAGVAVLESAPYWAPELIRELTPDRILVRACRSFADLDHRIAVWPQAVVVIDFDSQPVPSLQWLGTLRQRPFRPAILVCGTEASAEWEWLLRELGVTAFLPGLHSAVEVADQCRRWLR